jgi:hypothetical protein
MFAMHIGEAPDGIYFRAGLRPCSAKAGAMFNPIDFVSANELFVITATTILLVQIQRGVGQRCGGQVGNACWLPMRSFLA